MEAPAISSLASHSDTRLVSCRVAQSLCTITNMAIRRKDSFLWGRARPSLPPTESRPGEAIKIHKSELLDDIQNLRLHIRPVKAELHRREVEEHNKNVVRNRRFLRGKKKFNMDPKTGFNYLLTNNLLEWRAESVAEFLYKEEGLNKTAIGNVLGQRLDPVVDQFWPAGRMFDTPGLIQTYTQRFQNQNVDEMHLEILKAFVSLHEFSDLNLVQALRQFLWSFRLPGEAQKIDRMMEAFATRYCDCNPEVFQSTDTCYILSFAIIMLNTSLHNPNVKDKPSLQRFVSMNRGINNGDDLPTELLAKLYASIRSEPFKIPEDDGNDLTLTFFNPDREGWLLKMGGRVKTWKRRWFILTDSCLYYFKYTTDKDPIGIIPLENLCVRKLEDTSKSFCLELYNPKGQKIKACKTENKGQVVQGKHQSYKLNAASAEERDTWMDAIRVSVTKDPFYDLVSQRKRKVICNTDPADLSRNNT